jgi:hypothetical protein
MSNSKKADAAIPILSKTFLKLIRPYYLIYFPINNGTVCKERIYVIDPVVNHTAAMFSPIP